ncbi:MAG: hypothetical protein ACYSWU_28215, partial [Planctomycetota bacterium]
VFAGGSSLRAARIASNASCGKLREKTTSQRASATPAKTPENTAAFLEVLAFRVHQSFFPVASSTIEISSSLSPHSS